MKYTYCDSIRKNQCADKNGNSEPAESLNNNNLHSGGVASVGSENEDHENVKRGKRIDQKAISRLEAMAMSDDEDYGKNNSLFTCSQYCRYCQGWVHHLQERLNNKYLNSLQIALLWVFRVFEGTWNKKKIKGNWVFCCSGCCLNVFVDKSLVNRACAKIISTEQIQVENFEIGKKWKLFKQTCTNKPLRENGKWTFFYHSADVIRVCFAILDHD